MAKPYRAGLFLILIATLVLVGACGSPPSSAIGGSSGGTQTAKSAFKYSGKLDADPDAILAVLAMLNSEAKSNAAKLYLAEYLMVARDRFPSPSDDKQTWYVTFSMDRKADSDQGEKPYWESAAWMVFKDGTVMPSDRHAANATRILTDLRASST